MGAAFNAALEPGRTTHETSPPSTMSAAGSSANTADRKRASLSGTAGARSRARYALDVLRFFGSPLRRLQAFEPADDRGLIGAGAKLRVGRAPRRFCRVE